MSRQANQVANQAVPPDVAIDTPVPSPRLNPSDTSDKQIVVPWNDGQKAIEISARSGELVVIVGETGSGKTALALWLAHTVGGEVIGADSVQVYRRFDIGSGKPTAAELAHIPHHLLDVADPNDPFDAQTFVAQADEAIRNVRERGKVPIVCGGTFLWIRALLFGLADAPAAPAELRARLQAELRSEGSPALHSRLAVVDPEIAKRLHPNDALRIIRALEVHEMTGQKLSDLHREHGFRAARYPARLFGIRFPRPQFEARIEARVQSMLRQGLIGEVRELIAQGFAQSRPMGSVGYAQTREWLQTASRTDEALLAGEIVRATRIFARRQRTWLRDREVTWIEPSDTPE